jgi:DNA-binding XRE family transcriptional regulator
MTAPKTEHTQRAEAERARASEADVRGAGEESIADHVDATHGEKRSHDHRQAAAEARSSVKAKPDDSARNNVRKLRMERMMSKAELARRAGLSTLTIDRVEKGMACRMDTKRKILEALGLTPSDRVRVFGDDD